MSKGIYDFSDVALIVSHKVVGTYVIDGFVADSSITVERKNDRWSSNDSADGVTATLVRNPNKSSTVTFSLSQSSASLDLLNATADYAERNKKLDIAFSFTLVDKNSRTFFHSDFCIVGKPTTVEFGVNESGREFKINCSNMQEQIGAGCKLTQEEARIVRAYGVAVDDAWVS